jgi:hypothetical protein
MSHPSFTRSDLHSISAAAGHAELAGAIRRGLGDGGHPPASDYPSAPQASGIDRAIHLSTAAAVLAVTGIAAYVSYWQAYAVIRPTARPESAPGSSRPRSTAWPTPARW